MNTRVRLRRLTEKDATKEYARWFRDPEISRWITNRTPTVEGCRAYIEKWQGNSNAILWGIFINGRLVGTIKAEHEWRSSLYGGGTAVLGLLIGDSARRNHGIGTKAIRQAARWCFRHWKVVLVAAGVHPFNTRSMRAFEKAGFQVADFVEDHDRTPRVWLHLRKS